jgi:putative addiction module component (TIGR02574 family)
MTATEELLQRALTLPLGDRAEIAAQLLASLDGERDDDVERAWAAEIERRVQRAEAGETVSRPWSEVRARLLVKPPG